jgi:hypothetical protein
MVLARKPSSQITPLILTLGNLFPTCLNAPCKCWASFGKTSEVLAAECGWTNGEEGHRSTMRASAP